jgi:hypothetical protein
MGTSLPISLLSLKIVQSTPDRALTMLLAMYPLLPVMRMLFFSKYE